MANVRSILNNLFNESSGILRFRHWSIARRLKIGFGMLAVLLLVNVAMAYWQWVQIDSRLSQLVSSSERGTLRSNGSILDSDVSSSDATIHAVARVRSLNVQIFYGCLSIAAAGLFIALVVVRRIQRGIVKAANDLVQGAEIIGEGDRDHRITIKTADEFGQLARAFNKMVDNMQRTSDALVQVQHKAAMTDKLTGLPNRRAFDERMHELADAHQITGESFALALLDVDHFKIFNDTWGHQAGDEVLTGVGRLLDSFATDCSMRYGGEEFALLLPNYSVGQAAGLVEDIRQSIEAASFPYKGQRLNVTISAGVAEIRKRESIDDLIHRSDSALYLAKEAGRNRVFQHRSTANESKAPTQPDSFLDETLLLHSINQGFNGTPLAGANADDRANAAASS